MIATSNLTIQFGPKPLFENVNIKFADGNRYGLIGANGAGKSTFMKIIGGDLEPSAGSVSLESGLRLGKLRQDQFAFEDQLVIDVVMMGHTEMWAAMQERDAIYVDPAATDDDYMRAAELEAKFAEYDGYTAEARASELLLGLELPIEQHRLRMSEIVPGWKLRVLLAQALFSNPDVLLLDEPTNNLDIHTIRWLEGVLNGFDSTMVIISHDRHFLNQVCTHMADVDFGEIRVYPGNYDDYMLASTQARERLLANNAKAKERIAELQDFVSRFAANKSKSRQATSRLKQIDRIKAEQVEVKPSSRQNPYIRFEQNKPLHRFAINAEKLGKAYEQPVISSFNAMIEAGQKVAIIGANGVGKSTLLRLLANDLSPDAGELKWAENADIGYMAQDVSDQFESDLTVFDWMAQYRQPGDDDQAVRSVLGRLLFSADDIVKKVSILSGGEKNRMTFGRMMLGRHNILLLDEPTNHLDMESIESLQMALEKYQGTVVVVSHDRQFISGIADRIIEILPDGEIIDYSGDYDAYLASRGLEQ
ncbi:ABC-F family ATPase [Oligella urethralis]|uniref:Probable ATP-binding protein YbiT n=1 Tax=Oligella urethralis DNF00040 TaxID=1401065 RepID=A0A095Z3P3_9BURK|nr:ABC-F family ATPase [Oligella urethralis]KGF29315.1 ABC transporter ATP-binding protein [Oligella urethralis DNF00040]